MRAWLLALRLLKRDWRGGELSLLGAALALTVAAIVSVGLFAERIEQVLRRQGSELIAADLMLESSRPIAGSFSAEAGRLGLETASVIELRTVVMGAQSQLVVLKAVDPSYPLRGELRARAAQGAAEQTAAVPSPGTVLADDFLLRVLSLQVGEPLELGGARFTIAGILTHEPDEGRNLFAFAPRVLMNLADLEATGLLGPASRASHRLLIAGEPQTVAGYRDWLRARLNPNLSLTEAGGAQSEFSSAFERAARFLRLASLSTLLVSGTAIALASQRLAQHQVAAMAMMRCLGAPRHLLLWVFAARLLLFGLGASLIGCLLGWLGQMGLSALLGEWLKVDGLPPPSLRPLGIGVAVGLIALIGFGLPPLLQLGRVPPLLALRGELGAPRMPAALSLVAAASTLALLSLWQAGELALGLKLLAGVTLALGLLATSAWALIGLLKILAGCARGSWRLGLAHLTRRPTLTLLQVLGLGVGILALLLLTLVRLDLIESWRTGLPEGAPNHFLLNIQPHEAEAVQTLLQESGIQTSGMHPMLGGRLTRINGRSVVPSAYPDPRARRLASREFNLSYARLLQTDNRIIAGQWWSDEQAPPQFSVEEGIAETLGIRLGDTLSFWVSGRELDAPVTSLRSVHWDSFNVNFFVVAAPSLLQGEAATFITSLYLPKGQESLIDTLVQRFPGVLVIDVESVLSQVRRVIERGAQAVELIFGFTLAAGLVLIAVGLQSTLAGRCAEYAILRTLGASRSHLMASLVIELTATGLVAGLLAASFAQAIGWLLAHTLFELRFDLDPALWLIGVLVSALASGLVGIITAYPALQQPPAQRLGTIARL
ncbi:FtsX-like permease family protein [Caldichromatium japonicum]|uniref:FtsX-like permease family protein n=1 Tax=Caldichromatium japonicum TaxID=2699430 RepID=A0A6G7VD93_9GAMM|nr:FtsX-like permease family protein [Caldichromatium japonicum]QIK37922.1 FtsX-like permease family protein [Caldichromatium japonicum]